MAGKTLEQIAAENEQKLAFDQAKYQQEYKQQELMNELKAQQALAAYANSETGQRRTTGNPMLDAFDVYLTKERADDPFSITANAIRKTRIPQSDNVWETLGGNLLQGLGGGLFDSLGDMNVQDSFESEMLPTLKGSYPNANFGDGITPEVARLTLLDALKEQDYERSIEKEKNSQYYNLLGKILSEDPADAGLKLGTLSKLGVLPKGVDLDGLDFSGLGEDFLTKEEKIQGMKGSVALGTQEMRGALAQSLAEKRYQREIDALRLKIGSDEITESQRAELKLELQKREQEFKDIQGEKTFARDTDLLFTKGGIDSVLSDKRYKADMDMLDKKLESSSLADDKKASLLTQLQELKQNHESGLLDKKLASSESMTMAKIQSQTENLAKQLQFSDIALDKKAQLATSLAEAKNITDSSSLAEKLKAQENLVKTEYALKQEMLRSQIEAKSTSEVARRELEKELAAKEIEKDIKIAELKLGKSQTAGSSLGIDAQGTPSKLTDLLGRDFLADRIEATRKKLMREGAAPSTVDKFIKMQYGSELKMNDYAAKELENTKKQVAASEDILSKVVPYMEKAKPLLGPHVTDQAARYAAMKIPGVYSEANDAIQQINSAKAAMVTAARTVGTGSVSDYEDKMYLESGPNVSVSYSAMQEMVTRMAQVTKFQKEKQWLNNYVVGKGGSLTDADMIYDRINKLFPKYDPEVKSINLDRPDLQDIITAGESGDLGLISKISLAKGGVYDSFQPTQRTSSGSAPYQVGETYNGEKISRITRKK